MKAKLILHSKHVDEEGCITEIILWELPKPTLDRPHRIKGRCIVRYDNESGKGDHKHIGEKERPYKFESAEKLLHDFIQDVECLMGGGHKNGH